MQLPAQVVLLSLSAEVVGFGRHSELAKSFGSPLGEAVSAEREFNASEICPKHDSIRFGALTIPVAETRCQLKEVIAILRPQRWPATREAIQAMGVEEIVHRRVIGRGKQRGLRYLRRATDAGEGDMPYLPKRMVVCLVADESCTALVNAIIKVNQTSNLGDGKIFVRSLGTAQDIKRTSDAAAKAAVATRDQPGD